MFSALKIREKFSAASSDYDDYAFIQRRIGSELIRFLARDEKAAGSLLDIGTGTSYFLSQISLLYPDVKIFGLDFAPGMLKIAKRRGVRFLIQADTESLPFSLDSFDLIASNLAFQWPLQLDVAFSEVLRVLRPGRDFYFSIFGPHTFFELFECVNRVKAISDFEILPSKEKIYKALTHAGFSSIEITSSLFCEYFSDFLSIIRWLKLLGANQRGVRFSGLEARSVFKNAESLYRQNFSKDNKLIVSFEKIFVKAGKL